MGSVCGWVRSTFSAPPRAERWGNQVRMVFLGDQRGHGQSGSAPVDTYTVSQLGRDLELLCGVFRWGRSLWSAIRWVNDDLVARAAVPEEYGRTNRIVGAALISSAAQGLSRSPPR